MLEVITALSVLPLTVMATEPTGTGTQEAAAISPPSAGCGIAIRDRGGTQVAERKSRIDVDGVAQTCRRRRTGTPAPVASVAGDT